MSSLLCSLLPEPSTTAGLKEAECELSEQTYTRTNVRREQSASERDLNRIRIQGSPKSEDTKCLLPSSQGPITRCRLHTSLGSQVGSSLSPSARHFSLLPQILHFTPSVPSGRPQVCPSFQTQPRPGPPGSPLAHPTHSVPCLPNTWNDLQPLPGQRPHWALRQLFYSGFKTFLKGADLAHNFRKGTDSS